MPNFNRIGLKTLANEFLDRVNALPHDFVTDVFLKGIFEQCMVEGMRVSNGVEKLESFCRTFDQDKRYPQTRAC